MRACDADMRKADGGPEEVAFLFVCQKKATTSIAAYGRHRRTQLSPKCSAFIGMHTIHRQRDNNTVIVMTLEGCVCQETSTDGQTAAFSLRASILSTTPPLHGRTSKQLYGCCCCSIGKPCGVFAITKLKTFPILISAWNRLISHHSFLSPGSCEGVDK